jgi:hypothetical protein
MNFFRRSFRRNRQTNRPAETREETNSRVFRARIPDDIQPGEEFQVFAGNRLIRVRAPSIAYPGLNLQIMLSDGRQRPTGSFSAHVTSVDNKGPPAFVLGIPRAADGRGMCAGERIRFTIQDKQFNIACPFGE